MNQKTDLDIEELMFKCFLEDSYKKGYVDKHEPNDDSHIRYCYLYGFLLELKHRRELSESKEPCYYIKSCKKESCKGCKPSIKPRFSTCKHWITRCHVCDIDGLDCFDGYHGELCPSYSKEEKENENRT